MCVHMRTQTFVTIRRSDGSRLRRQLPLLCLRHAAKFNRLMILRATILGG